MLDEDTRLLLSTTLELENIETQLLVDVCLSVRCLSVCLMSVCLSDVCLSDVCLSDVHKIYYSFQI